MHMHAMQHGLTLLAEQSVYAQLVIERRRATVTPQQQKNDGFYKTYLTKDAATNVPASEYSITNLPNTILTLPANSIYDRILFIAKDAPDFRLVPVDGNNVSQTNTCVVRGTSTFDPDEKINLTSALSGIIANKQPLFADTVPIKPSDVSTHDAMGATCSNVTRNPFEAVFGNPLTLQSSEVSPELMTRIRRIIENTVVEPEEELTDSEAVQVILDAMKINQSVVTRLSENNAPIDYDSVRVGLLINIKRQLGDNFVVNETSAGRIASTISEYVRARVAS